MRGENALAASRTSNAGWSRKMVGALVRWYGGRGKKKKSPPLNQQLLLWCKVAFVHDEVGMLCTLYGDWSHNCQGIPLYNACPQNSVAFTFRESTTVFRAYSTVLVALRLIVQYSRTSFGLKKTVYRITQGCQRACSKPLQTRPA